MVTSEDLELLLSSHCLRIETNTATRQGFVHVVHDVWFEFDHITNPAEFFSNKSEEPMFDRVTIRFVDVVSVRRV